MIRTSAQTVTPEPVPAEVAPRDEHIAPAPRVSVQAFCETVETAAAIQSAGEDRRLGKAHVKIQMGGITAAIEAYRGSPTPNVIMLEADGRGDSILTGLDALAEFCDAGTRVVEVIWPKVANSDNHSWDMHQGLGRVVHPDEDQAARLSALEDEFN